MRIKRPALRFGLALAVLAAAGARCPASSRTLSWDQGISIPDVLQEAKQRPAPRIYRESAISNPALRQSDVSANLDALTGSVLTENNAVEFFIDGDAMLPELLAAIDGAQESICYAAYGFLPRDLVARKITDHLIAAHRRGIVVRMVADGFGSREFPKLANDNLALLRAAGIPVRLFNPITTPASVSFQREHRKIKIIDDRIAFVGGMNTGERYMGDAEVRKRKHDVMARIQGPAVRDAISAFEDSWDAAGGSRIETGRSRSADQAGGNAGSAKLRVIRHAPLQDHNIENAYLLLIGAAQESIDIENSYPMTQKYADALVLAARRGVRVRYIVGSSEGILGILTKQNFRRMLRAGVRIFIYPTPVHTKALSIDGKYCAWGSANVDNFSEEMDREIIVIAQDERITRDLNQALFEQDVIGDSQGRKTIELPADFKESFWIRLRDAILWGIWPDDWR